MQSSIFVECCGCIQQHDDSTAHNRGGIPYIGDKHYLTQVMRFDYSKKRYTEQGLEATRAIKKNIPYSGSTFRSKSSKLSRRRMSLATAFFTITSAGL